MSRDISDGQWIQTYTGRRFWPLNPDSVDLDILDIAHALSMQCRFTGHTDVFYSVAQHSVHVSELCERIDKSFALWGLLHDASEAYLQDLARPIKHSPALQEYRKVEKILQDLIFKTFGLQGECPKDVYVCDNILLRLEADKFMSPLCEGWSLEGISNSDFIIPKGWSPDKAMLEFMDRYDYLNRH